MDPTQLIVLISIGLTGGLLSGLIGVGGGVFFVPALSYAVGWDIREAVAASLVIVVFSSLAGTIRNSRSDDPVEWRTAGILSLAVAPSSLIGVAISRISPETVVEIAFAALLIALAYPTAKGGGDLEGKKKLWPPLVFLVGIFIGALSGLVGVGGGVMMVPLMVLGMGLGTKRAVSTSLAIVMFTGIVGSAGYIATGFHDPEQLLSLPPFIVGSMFGASLGVRLRSWTPEGKLRVGFGVFMVVVALNLLSEALDFF